MTEVNQGQSIETADLSHYMIEPRQEESSKKIKWITLLLVANLLLGVVSFSGVGYLIYKQSQQVDFSGRGGMMVPGDGNYRGSFSPGNSNGSSFTPPNNGAGTTD